MKRIIYTLLAAIAVTPMAAHSQQSESPCRMGWGIRASIDINVPGHMRHGGESVKMFKNGAGVNIGAVYTMPLGQYLFFQPGAGIFYDTYRYDNITISAEPGEGQSVVDPAVRKSGIRIPLHIGYNLDIWQNAAVSFYTGPQFDYSFYGRVSTSSHGIDWSDSYNDNLFGPYNQRRFDIAWKVGVGIPMNHWYIGLEAAFGLLDLMRTDFTYHENRVSLTLGYNF